MEINVFAIFIVSSLIIGLPLFLKDLGKRNLLSNLWHSVEVAALPAGLVAGIVYSITTDVYVVHADGSHESKNVLWSYTVTDQYGMEKKLGGLGMGNKFIYNATSYPLTEYCVYYGSKQGGNKPSLTIYPGIPTKTSNTPDYYFEEPGQIQVEKDLFDMIHDLFSGSSDERWIIDYAH